MKEFYQFVTLNPELTFFCFAMTVWGLVQIIESLVAPFKAPHTIIKNEKATRSTPSDRVDGKR